MLDALIASLSIVENCVAVGMAVMLVKVVALMEELVDAVTAVSAEPLTERRGSVLDDGLGRMNGKAESSDAIVVVAVVGINDFVVVVVVIIAPVFAVLTVMPGDRRIIRYFGFWFDSSTRFDTLG